MAGSFNASSEVSQLSGGNSTIGFVLPTILPGGLVLAMLVAFVGNYLCDIVRHSCHRHIRYNIVLSPVV